MFSRRKQGNNQTWFGTGSEYREKLSDLNQACVSLGLATSGVHADVNTEDPEDRLYSLTVWISKKEQEHLEWMHDRLMK